MNAPMVRALMQDALYQVLDNRVFRVLLVLVLIPILFTFIVGFREEGIVFLFGLERWGYDGLLELSPQPVNVENGRELVIANFTALVVDFLGGDIGVMLAIAATAFFVPQMIEKGSADVLFHKPIHRFMLYLSRYFAGLVFVALASFVAVAGVYLGLLIVSGYNDPGILWGAVTITYLFGLVHCVSMLVGVVTRSTVAAILVTLLFFFGNGCLVQRGWILKEQVMLQRERLVAAEKGGLENAGEHEAEEEERPKERGLLLTLALGTLDGLHYVLPKTTDAGHLTALLRKAFEEGEAYEDESSGLVVLTLLPGFAEVDAASATPPVADAQALVGSPRFAAASAKEDARLVVFGRERRVLRRSFAGKEREIPERARDAGEELEKLLAERLGLGKDAIETSSEPVGSGGRTQDMGPMFLTLAAHHVAWTAGERHYHVVFCGSDESFHALVMETPAAMDVDVRGKLERDLLAQCGVPNEASQNDWYTNQLGWTAELKYNLFFSIGSSLAFAALMLMLGGWRLGRVDF